MADQADEARLLEKLRRIQALFEGAATQGERVAAEEALKRVRARLHELPKSAVLEEFQFSLHDPWSYRLFSALLRRYDIRPYRYRGQRRTTIMCRVDRAFLDKTLWPEFGELQKTLHAHLDEVAARIIAQAVHGDASEPSEMEA
ncbi:MAG: hypothetical protein HY901_21595, partial [Deltaproteobacteria bacterium]|nr:hypothetical protein [Deltaproteobacteria bacterium]